MEFFILRGGVPEEVLSKGVMVLEFFLILWGSFGAIRSSNPKTRFLPKNRVFRGFPDL
ncbi:hypothetical protein MTR_8g080820 [Medicago truncatula]|uniref:Uncharacterized protein n=1 Tax=Medicago truncatula TaxID=3880 RepID=A0A072TTU6_MEDTR|nr:hypothetical protein MTR_8g080820 [Medicago truncatula]